MQSPRDLKKITVLVTRPQPLGEPLCTEIVKSGGLAIYFPTIDIQPPEDQSFFQQQMTALAQYDWVIFVSPQAVLRAHPFITDPPTNIAAMGAGTANALRSLHFTVNACPVADWNTEGLLSLPEFQMLKDKKIAIVKGQGGREALFNALTQQGALVTEIIAYQRALPQIDVSQYTELLRTEGIDVILCTSIDGLLNLKILLDAEWMKLRKIPLLLISERMKVKAQELEFETIFLARNASNEAVLDALATVRSKAMDTQVKKPVQPVSRKPFSWKKLVAGLLILALILLAGLFYLSYVYYLKISAQTTQAQEQSQQLQHQVVSLEAQTNQLTDKINAQTPIINALQQTQTGFNRNEWLILEAEFLVKLANDQLQFENNAEQAIRLLQAADNQIRTLNDASLIPLRKALADDIANLKSVDKIDVPGSYLQLAALDDQINKLPLINHTEEPATAPTSTTEVLPWWKKGMHETWQQLKQIVVVRYHEAGKPPLVLPETRDFLYLNLHSALEKTMWGLLHQQPAIYNASITQLTQWVKEYFILDSPVTQNVLTSLEQLQKLNVKPTLSTVSASLQAFQDYFASHKQ